MTHYSSLLINQISSVYMKPKSQAITWKQFNHPDYKSFLHLPDLVTMVWNYITAEIQKSPNTRGVSCLVVKIKANTKTFSIANIYARDRTLTSDILSRIHKIHQNLLVVGDFNAVHRDILTYTLDTPHNTKGKNLYNYLCGLDIDAVTPPTYTFTIWIPTLNGLTSQEENGFKLI